MYFVTFTRKLGTNGSEIARRVADELHYNLYDTEAIENTAREMGFLNDVKAVDEKVPSIFERIFSHRSEIYLDRLNSVIYELASRGNAVFLGRGSHVLLKNLNCALSVRVIASLERRIKNMEGRAFGREEAIKAIHRSDSQRGAFIKFAFGVDWENPELYDVVLNMDNMTVDLATDTVVHIARTEEVKARGIDVISFLERSGLERRAEAAILEGGFSLSSVSVSVNEPGNVELTGMLHTEAHKQKIEEILWRVRGVASVDNRVEVEVFTTEFPRRLGG